MSAKKVGSTHVAFGFLIGFVSFIKLFSDLVRDQPVPTRPQWHSNEKPRHRQTTAGFRLGTSFARHRGRLNRGHIIAAPGSRRQRGLINPLLRIGDVLLGDALCSAPQRPVRRRLPRATHQGPGCRQIRFRVVAPVLARKPCAVAAHRRHHGAWSSARSTARRQIAMPRFTCPVASPIAHLGL